MIRYFTNGVIICMAVLLCAGIIMFIVNSPEPLKFDKDNYREKERAYINGIILEIGNIINNLESEHSGGNSPSIGQLLSNLYVIKNELSSIVNGIGLSSTVQYNRKIKALLADLDTGNIEERYLKSEVESVIDYLEGLIIKWIPDPVIIEKGRMVYWRNCVMCHGADGKGIALREFGDNSVSPRNFHGEDEKSSKPLFKYVGKEGRLPTDKELLLLLKRGIAGTPMKSFSSLGDRQLGYVIEYIKIFDYIQWKYSSPVAAEKEILQPPLELSSESFIVNGRKLYQGLCMNCHGNFEVNNTDDGHIDYSGRNFVNEPLKRGDDPEELFNTVKYGIPSVDDIGMPSNPQLSDKELWQVVSYILHLLNNKIGR